jgi:predicted nuclease with TOPRIM domain
VKAAWTKALPLVAAAVVALAAGCGGGGSERLSKSEYEQKIKAEGSQLKTAFSAVDLTNPANMRELTTKITSLQQELEQSADDIEALKPPEDAEAANAKLADTLHKAAVKFGELKRAAEALDQQRIQQLTQEVGTVLQKGRAATDELKAKGYDIGALGEG